MPYLRLTIPKRIEDDLKLVLDYSRNVSPNVRGYLNKYLMKSEDLPERSIKDSFMEGRLQLATDKTLRKTYQTSSGKTYIRYPGTPTNQPSPFALVTFHVDQIDFTDYIPKANVDILFTGHVTWAGKSTLELVVWCEQQINGEYYKICSSLFLLAVRDATCREAAPANPLAPLNDYEKEVLRNGILRKDKRKKRFLEHISKIPPTSEELQEIHEIYANTTEESKTIANCSMSNVVVIHLEDINALTAVFGGTILSHAYDLAWLLAWKFSGHAPILKRIGDVTFYAPAIKYTLRLDAQVVYTYSNYYQIFVIVYIMNQTEEDVKASSFHFTFKSDESVAKVYPSTYHEAMLFIDGKRHFDSFMSDEDGTNGRDLSNDYLKLNHKISKL